ncbi:winged helix-turn-helix domain-containing protein [Paenibacillus marinisediminis]
MAIPDFQSIMLPFLKQVSDQQEHKHRETIDMLAKHFQLTSEEVDEKLPSGRQTIFDNRVGWSRTYLMKAGLIEDPRRGYCKITAKGIDVLNSNPSIINVTYLRQFPEFMEFHTAKTNGDQQPDDQQDIISEQRTPGENLEYSYLVYSQRACSRSFTAIKSGKSSVL